MKVAHHVHRRQVGQGIVGVGAQDLVIEAQYVVADHQVGLTQGSDEVAHLLLGVIAVDVLGRVIGHGNRQAHAANVAPTSHFVGEVLGLYVKSDDIAHTVSFFVETLRVF
ncbi:MAG: hypothetical protein B6I35_11900 [Anaerolineaceae bacterium 4572_32.2]|nr:MAG: hypothetical protein B6I35_11900 [Anaerolineaceae bacterium 4572_32.2]